MNNFEIKATEEQLAELNNILPGAVFILNEYQIDTLATNLDQSFVLSDSVNIKVRDLIELMVEAGDGNRENLTRLVVNINREKLRAMVDEKIAKYGYTKQGVFPSEESPGFCYTVGYSQTSGLEFIACAGTNVEHLAEVVDTYVDLHKKGEDITKERDDCLMFRQGGHLRGLRTKAVKVNADEARVDHICQTRGPEVFDVYQILIADKNNLLPDEQDYDKNFAQVMFTPC